MRTWEPCHASPYESLRTKSTAIVPALQVVGVGAGVGGAGVGLGVGDAVIHWHGDVHKDCANCEHALAQTLFCTTQFAVAAHDAILCAKHVLSKHLSPSKSFS